MKGKKVSDKRHVSFIAGWFWSGCGCSCAEAVTRSVTQVVAMRRRQVVIGEVIHEKLWEGKGATLQTNLL